MPAEKIIKVLIAEDQALIRFGLTSSLESYTDLKVICESKDGVAAIMDSLAHIPDVILMDIGLPRINGIAAAKHIKEALPGVRIIIFTASDDQQNINAALSAGADGYCLKGVSGDHLYAAIKAVTRGVSWLDPGIAEKVLLFREGQAAAPISSLTMADMPLGQTLSDNEVLALRLLSEGSTLDQVADQLSVSVEKVEKLLNNTIGKLQAKAIAARTPPNLSPVDIPERTTLGDCYFIESVLGRGGMGIVYKGKHRLMDRVVAIKMLHPEYVDDEVVVQRFQSEAKSLSVLSHPNLVTVFDFGMTPDSEPYLVMAYHNGKSLDDIIQNGKDIDLVEAVSIFSQVCDALTAVHDHHMVHRDIKPSNIVISENGLVKLVDFGIAKSVASRALSLTMDGEVVGTPKYMSPEQCLGKELDARSDIYALGCVMYEVFAGQAPFEADSFYEMVHQHLNAKPSNLPFKTPTAKIPPAMQEVVFRTLEKAPNERHQTAAQLKSQLQAVVASL